MRGWLDAVRALSQRRRDTSMKLGNQMGFGRIGAAWFYGPLGPARSLGGSTLK